MKNRELFSIRRKNKKSAQLISSCAPILFLKRKNQNMPRCSTYSGNGEPFPEYVEHERPVISLREDSHALRLASELADLRAAKPNPCVLRTPCRSRRVIKIKKSTAVRLVLIRMFTVGAIIDRPQTTAKPKRATNGRPYKRISAENLFSLPICVIMGLHRRAGACSRRNERFCFMQRRHQGTALQRGMGLARCQALLATL